MQTHRVLIVEDEQDIAGLIKHTLERSGSAEAEVVGSGDAALKAVSARPPDLIILDLNLPVLGGLEVWRLRSRAREQRLYRRASDERCGRNQERDSRSKNQRLPRAKPPMVMMLRV